MAKPDEKYMEETIERVLTSQPKPKLAVVSRNQATEPEAVYGNPEMEYASIPNTLYNAKLALVPEELAAFVRTSQPQKWELLVKRCDGEAQATKRLAERVSREIDMHGTIKVLRMDEVDAGEGVYVKLMYNRPASDKTPEHIALYNLNRLGVMRQVHYSEKATAEEVKKNPLLSIDMAIFLNGLPIITLELKNELTGQTHHNAVKQFIKDRNPQGEKLLEFKRCLVHFAVGTEQVFMTTKLEGADTYFLPYNQSFANIGVESEDYRTNYLWKDVLRRDSIIDLVSHYINVHKDTKKETPVLACVC